MPSGRERPKRNTRPFSSMRKKGKKNPAVTMTPVETLNIVKRSNKMTSSQEFRASREFF